MRTRNHASLSLRVIIGGLLLAAGAGACGTSEMRSQGSVFSPALQIDESSRADYLLDFGQVILGDRKIEAIDVTNGGNAPLVLVSDPVSSPFSRGTSESELAIAVGATGQLLFAFEPIEAANEADEVIISVRTNEGGGRTHTIRLVGRGVAPGLHCSPASLDFGSITKGGSKTLTASCSNPLPIPLDFEERRLGGAHLASFRIAVLGWGEGPVTVPSGGTVTISVTFEAESMGENEASLELQDAFENIVALLPLRATTIQDSLIVEPESCLDFSYVALGETRTEVFRVENIGDTSRTITRLFLPEESRADFSLLFQGPLDLEPGGPGAELAIEFHPSTAGAHQAPIEIQTDGAAGGQTVIAACVKGFGGGPAMTCIPDAKDFGSVAIGIPVRTAFRCTNTGTTAPGATIDPLRIQGIRSSAPEFEATILDPFDRSQGPKPAGYAIGESFLAEVQYAPTAERFESAQISIDSTSVPDGVVELSVSGQGRSLPSCDFSLEPPRLRFGIVDRGDVGRQTFVIRNHLETSCLLNDLRLADGSDPAFSVEAIGSLELAGYQSLEIEVTFAPADYQPNFKGAVEFQISSEGNVEQRVELEGSSGNPCIRLEPAHLDFGHVEPGCQTEEAWLVATNICGRTVTIESATVSESVDAGVFQIMRRPLLPMVLHPNERAEFTLAFAPTIEGMHHGSVALDLTDSEPYVARLSGEASSDPYQTDTFNQRAQAKVDILWVIDNSGSFEPYQEKIARNLNSFLSVALEQNIDFHLAVTTSGLFPVTDACPGGARGGEDGRFFPIDGSHPRILTPITQDLELHWSHNVKVGTCHGIEQYFEAAYRALSPPLINETKSSKYADQSLLNDGNAGFLRREASLSIIFVADEEDQSTEFRSIPKYIEFFRGLKGKNMFKAHAITGPKIPRNGCNVLARRMHEMVDATGGTLLDICTPLGEEKSWTEGFRRMSEGAFGFAPRFILRGTPDDKNGDGRVDEDDIEVTLDGQRQLPVNETLQRRWSYDPVARAITFDPLFVPKAGTQIAATYKVACIRP